MINPFRSPDSQLGRGVAKFIGALIILTLFAVVIETLPDLPPWIRQALSWFEIVAIGVFTVEYVLRVMAAGRSRRYVLSFLGLADLLAILPFYLGLAIDLRGLRGFRLLRLFTIFKLTRYSEAADRLLRAVRSVRAEIIVFLMLSLIVIYLCGVFVYFLEHEAQPDRFKSALDGFWWALASLTTVGYGDIYPITPLGKLFTGIVLIVGLGIVAVPTGLIAAALTRDSESRDSK